MEEHILSTCSSPKIVRVRTSDCLLFHRNKHVTAQGHFETLYMNAISSGAMCMTIDVNAPEKNYGTIGTILIVHENGTNLGRNDFRSTPY